MDVLNGSAMLLGKRLQKFFGQECFLCRHGFLMVNLEVIVHFVDPKIADPLLDFDHAGMANSMMQAQKGSLSRCQIVMGAESAET